MSKIILIETSTALCSTALLEDGVVSVYKETDIPREQASKTAVFVKEMLDERSLRVSDCDAVCVSMGPGSYTGLRVGVSTAKGLCFGANIPLLAIGTLDILVAQARSMRLPESVSVLPPFSSCDGPHPTMASALVQFSAECAFPAAYKYIVPMIDARRMEVYAAVFTPEGRQLTETEPMVITGKSFEKELFQGPVLFIGDGAGKCSGVLDSPNAHFLQCCPRADAMGALADTEYKEKRFKDLAYFEPFYLKQFLATVSTKKLF